MKLRLLAIATVSAGCLVLSACSVNQESQTQTTTGMPIPIEPNKKGWLIADYWKIRKGASQAWKYGTTYIYKIFFLEDGGYFNAGFTVGPSSAIHSFESAKISKPYLRYNCTSEEWEFDKGKILQELTDKHQDDVRTYLLIDGQYTGIKPWGEQPWLTTGYDPQQKGWKEKFSGKSGHGIDQLSGNQSNLATLIAQSKEAVLVSGTENQKVYFEFSFETPPDEMNKQQICDFALKGKAIIAAS